MIFFFLPLTKVQLQILNKYNMSIQWKQFVNTVDLHYMFTIDILIAWGVMFTFAIYNTL